MCCPSCGAKLDVNEDLEKYTCNYCGVTTLLDKDEIKHINITSKLTNRINEIKEYYDNGNYKKTYELSSELIKEYPNNKEIMKYYEKSMDKSEYDEAISYVDKVVESDFNHVGTYSDYKIIERYHKLFPNDKKIEECYYKIRQLQTGNSKLIAIVLTLSIITIVVFMFLIIFANS